MKPGYKMRTRKLIDKSLQLRLVGAFVAVGCVATLFQVVLLNQSMLGFAEKLPKVGISCWPRLPDCWSRACWSPWAFWCR